MSETFLHSPVSSSSALEGNGKGNEALIEVRDLTAGYGETTILENVSFRVYPGEIFVVLGGSGCGKSTLLKNMIGLNKPLQGSVLIAGQDIAQAEGTDRDRILRRFGVLYQSGALLSSMTVGENVALPLEEFTSLEREQIELIVRLKLQLVAMEGSEQLLPSQLSGGMRKRAGLARAMALDPEILFFDEPSAGLDPVTSADLDSLILELNSALGTTMVLITHELESIMTTATRVIMLDRSTRGIIAEGDPRAMKTGHPDPRVRDFFQRKPSLRRR
jgi:phospholipid/cholesterol/gamma-HCH transport system ATP-binding protein